MMRNILTAVAGLLAAGLLLLLFSCSEGDTREGGALYDADTEETAGTIDTGSASGMPMQNGSADVTTEPEQADANYGAVETGGEESSRHEWPESTPLYGVISTVEGSVLLLDPEVPEFIRESQGAERVEAAAGQDESAMSPAVSLMLTADTGYQVEGAAQDDNPFGSGDEVVVWAARPDAANVREAVLLIDLASFKANWLAWHGAADRDSETLPGEPELLLPMYGEILVLTEGLITVEPELPGEAGADEQAAEPPMDVPDTFSYVVDSETRFMRNGVEVDQDSFEVGDLVLVVPRRPDPGEPEPELPIAALVSDSPMAGPGPDELELGKPAPEQSAGSGSDLLQPGGGRDPALPPTTGI
ncbi:MAG TPA: hypothetical protein ENO21_03790 [Firmicutes bacterium]|nr:hypothetical protein [Bacillota bacterium]